MGDFILINDDEVLFDSNFGAAVVDVRPGNIKASGPATLKSTQFCVTGDEATVAVQCTYLTATHSTKGTGMLKIDTLAVNQIATKTNSGNKPVLLKGGVFTARFEVLVPATQPPPSTTTDTTVIHYGTGRFATKNDKFQAT
ncbi:MAG TPA: hypothetical protein PK156_00115 [Polyangium sp.]|nr:hypothetical protein [Polyangium sp.]